LRLPWEKSDGGSFSKIYETAQSRVSTIKAEKSQCSIEDDRKRISSVIQDYSWLCKKRCLSNTAIRSSRTVAMHGDCIEDLEQLHLLRVVVKLVCCIRDTGITEKPTERRVL
jgi:hypothetical protein